MRLLHRQGSTTGETPKQTLDRLDRANSSRRLRASDEPRKHRHSKPRSRQARNVPAGVTWTLGGIVLYLWILIEEDLSWSDAAAFWVLTVVGLGLLYLLGLGIDKLMGSFSALDGTSWWHGGAGWMSEHWDTFGDGGDGGCDGGGFDGGSCDGG